PESPCRFRMGAVELVVALEAPLPLEDVGELADAELADGLLPEAGEDPLAAEIPLEPAVAGSVGPRPGAMSLLIRLRSARVSRLSSTASRPAWAWSSCTCIATYKAAMRSTPIAADKRTSSKVKP